MLASITSMAQAQEADTLRSFWGIDWGSSKEEVEEAHESEPYDLNNDDIVGYEVLVGGKAAITAFYFPRGRLARGRYHFTESHTNENTYLTDFNEISEFLQEAYGAPEVDTEVWLDEVYRSDPDRYGFAVSVGDYRLVEKWELTGGRITHVLYGENYNIFHVVEFSSTALEHLFEASIEQ